MEVAVETQVAEDSATPESAVDIEAIAAKVFGGDTPAAPEPPAEPEKVPAAEPPKPPTESVSARILAAKRADLKAAQARAELAAQKAELEKIRSEVSEKTKLYDELKAAKLSPSKVVELLGMTPKEFLESLATEHEPEAVAKRVMSSALSETEKLRIELAELKAAQEAKEREAHDRASQEASARAQEAFLAHISGAPETYPNLIEEFTPEEIAQKAWELAAKHAEPYFKRFGVYPDDDVIAEELENQAKARAEQRAAWRAKTGQSATPPSKGQPTGNQAATQQATGPSPRTLTSRAASEKATAPPKWNQEQADAESLRILEAALKHTG